MAWFLAPSQFIGNLDYTDFWSRSLVRPFIQFDSQTTNRTKKTVKTNTTENSSQRWHRLRCFCVGATMLLLGANLVSADVTIDLTSGGSGSLTGVPQSYNETRAVDVSVLSGADLLVHSMTLAGFDGSGIATSATLGARIYDTLSQALIASANVTISAVGPVTIPISATLVSGAEYRIGFFAATTPPNNGEGTLFQPSGFPHTETTGLLRINGAFDIATDSFPANSNIFEPQVSLQVVTVPEPGNMTLLGLGIGLLGVYFRRRRHSYCCCRW
jgi:PEP-CTERM motif